MSARRRRWGFAAGLWLAVLTAATCYRPRSVDCVLVCKADAECPHGMSCSAGLCSAGTTCALTVAAGETHSCATVAGTLKCWGHNASGQLGTGDRDDRGDNPGEMGDSLPAVNLGRDRALSAAAAAPGQSTIALGSFHTCALLDGGQVKCWGDNRAGQLGIGDSRARFLAAELGDALPPVALGDGQTAVALTAGVFHTCALLAAGTVKCWGDNRFGQLGSGARYNRGGDGDAMGDTLPAVDLGDAAVAVVAGAYHTCALLASRAIKCWGWNDYGQLGAGDARSRGRAAADMGAALPPVALGDGRWASQVAAGAFHTCALLWQTGDVMCWGLNAAGQLGVGDVGLRGNSPETLGDRLPVIDLGANGPAQAIAAGAGHTCVVLRDFSVRCWGLNVDGQLGIGTSDNRGDEADERGDRLPNVALGGTSGAVSSLAAGANHTCAVQAGVIKCWGTNLHGRLGVGDDDPRGDGHRAIAAVHLEGAAR